LGKTVICCLDVEKDIYRYWKVKEEDSKNIEKDKDLNNIERNEKNVNDISIEIIKKNLSEIEMEDENKFLKKVKRKREKTSKVTNKQKDQKVGKILWRTEPDELNGLEVISLISQSPPSTPIIKHRNKSSFPSPNSSLISLSSTQLSPSMKSSQQSSSSQVLDLSQGECSPSEISQNSSLITTRVLSPTKFSHTSINKTRNKIIASSKCFSSSSSFSSRLSNKLLNKPPHLIKLSDYFRNSSSSSSSSSSSFSSSSTPDPAELLKSLPSFLLLFLVHTRFIRNGAYHSFRTHFMPLGNSNI
jgi:hypothetical protein